jgi:hypothetical protein
MPELDSSFVKEFRDVARCSLLALLAKHGQNGSAPGLQIWDSIVAGDEQAGKTEQLYGQDK